MVTEATQRGESIACGVYLLDAVRVMHTAQQVNHGRDCDEHNNIGGDEMAGAGEKAAARSKTRRWEDLPHSLGDR